MTVAPKPEDIVYDPSDPMVMANPFPIYAQLREVDPSTLEPIAQILDHNALH